MRDMAGNNAAGDGAPADRYFLERRLNENSTDFAHLGYPGYPNEAGVAWINMVKFEFTSNFTYENLQNDVEIYSGRAFFGEYDLEVKSVTGDILYLDTLMINQNDTICDHYNLIGAGLISSDFDDDMIGIEFTVPTGEAEITWDGYLKDGLKVCLIFR